LEEYKQARYHLRKATNIDPNFAEAFHKIGENYRREEKWDKSESFFERAVKLAPKETEYLTSLADAYFNLSKVSEALELYHKVVDLDPRDRDHWINLAAALFDAEAFEESLSVLDKSEKLFADNAYIYYIKAAFQYHLGHRNEAMVNLQKGLLKNFEDHNLLFSISPEMETDDEILQLVEQYRNN
jgi:tetratricopeptide (TPR) repeat protein